MFHQHWSEKRKASDCFAKRYSFTMQKCNENYNKFSFSPPFNSNCCVERSFFEGVECLAACNMLVVVGETKALESHPFVLG